MKKGNISELLIIVFMVIVVGAGAVGITMFVMRDKPVTNPPSSSVESEPTVQKVLLDIADKSPLRIQVKQGDYIQFEPSDSSKHQIVSSGDGEHATDAFDSGVFESTQSYRLQVKDLGTFELKDTYNPEKSITVEAR